MNPIQLFLSAIVDSPQRVEVQHLQHGNMTGLVSTLLYAWQIQRRQKTGAVQNAARCSKTL